MNSGTFNLESLNSQTYENKTYDGSSSYLFSETESKGFKKPRARYLYFGGAAVLLIVVVVAIVLGVTLGGKSGAEDSNVEGSRGEQAGGTESTATPTDTTPKPPLIVVSLDGFRAEYLLRNLTPTIQKLRDCGVHTPYMRSVYPTLTFPNHYTIVTGLYPESHGIVGNSMYDFKYNETFFIGAKTTTNSHWWGGEPIWVTARKQGLKTASYFWVGSETNISELIMLYFDEPDHQGHGTGPDSEEVNEMLGKVDSLIGYLMNSLLAKNMDNCVNLVVLADHGMASTACERKIALDTWLPEVDNMLVYSGTTGYIQPEYRRLGRDAILENEQVVSTETITSSLDCKSDKLRLFTKTNIPVRHHYANNYRIGDVVVDVQDTWMFSSTNDSWCLHGNHGYDNVYKSMHALFLAHGPGFKQQYSVDPFENIELYNVMAALLNITPAPNNGTSGSLDNILASPPPRPTEATHVLETCNDVDRQCDCQYTTYDACCCFVSIIKRTEFISHNEAEAWWNKVPLFSGFRTGIWSYLWTVTKEYASTYGDIHVTTGPIYDHNNDGLADENVHNSTKFVDDAMHVQLPSHMYIILVKCTQNNTSAITCPDEHLAVSSFVLPQMNKTANCMTGRDYLINNAARVRDIEHLTGHQFFTSMDVPLGARLRTFLPLELWPFSLSSTTKQPQTTAQITTPTPTTKPHSTTPLPVWLEQPCPADNNPQCPWSAPPLIVVSLDGFRAEYLLRNLTPTMQKLRDCGVHTPYMRAAYPTLTFPNHYTIVTGLYPESHGIVGNSMYDSKHNGTFSISGSGKFDSYWWGGEPIWTTTQKHGKKAASFFWVGSEMNISGYQPDYWMPYDGSITYEARIDKAMEWLSMPDNERPELIMLYFDEPDHQGHGAGPDSEEVNTMLQRVDDLIAYLMGSLLSKKIDNCVNLILLADHVVQTETIVESLQCKSANARVFSRKDIPVRHHYSNNDRIGEVVVDVHDSWLFEPKPTKSCLKGNHGYDNVYKSMHALFLAHGPGFKQQFTAEPFENIELYNVMTALLNITGAPNNGTSGSLDHMLTSPPDRSTEATRVHDICAAVNSTCDCRVEGYHSDPDTCLQSCTEFTNTAKGIETVRLYDPGKWNYLWRLINENAVQSDEIHITTGPIYDHNYDGLADMSSHNNTMFVDESNSVPLPSHIYTILVKCTKTNTTLLDCHPEDLAVLSFVLPHVNETHNCLPDKEYLINNVARVRDIEHLTGQRFFTALDVPLSARLRTYLPLDLWSTPLITPWVDLPCQLPDDTTCPSGPKPLVLISLDGFRADYLQRGLTPTLKKLSECGVHAPFMRPVYPTVTFPNHYTIGLYPESHGIVNNDMVDEDIGQIFGITGANASDSRWWKAEPLKSRERGLQHFIGLELTLTSQVNGQLETMDRIISEMMSALYEQSLHNCVNIIVLSDHGFAPSNCDQTVRIKDLYPDISNMLMFDEAVGQIYTRFGNHNKGNVRLLDKGSTVSEVLSNLTCKNDVMKVFTKDQLPKRLHYANSDRIGDIILDMKEEWLVYQNSKSYCDNGNHGWDNINKNMHALFLAHGPAFKDNFIAEPFENIEIYNLLSDILDITPLPNNGTDGSLDYMFKDGNSNNAFPDTLIDYGICLGHAQVQEEFFPSCGCASNTSNINITTDEGLLVNDISQITSPQNICILNQTGYITGFNSEFKAPSWIQTSTRKSQLSNKTTTCIINDTRVGHDPCSIELSSGIGFYPLTKYGIYTFIHKLIADYDDRYGEISVSVGTVFDYNNDGLWEGIINETEYADVNQTQPLPSHIYFILTKCKDGHALSQCGIDLDVLPFIIPHLPKIPNCLNPGAYLKDNVARIRDIELLTGLTFMKSFERGTGARMKTFLPEEIWETILIQPWQDMPCPVEDMCQSDYRPLLLISLDGFRADYLLRNVTPTVSRLSQCGVRAPYMRSVYPTKTFPNHYSIVTGLYPESHGIIDNNMYDTEMMSVSYFARTQEVLSWMSLPKGERPDFVTLYFDEPDLAGHKYGPSNEKEIGAALKRVDDTLAYLMEGLVHRNLHNCVNLVIIADHGMSDVKCNQVLKMQYHVPNLDYSYLTSNFWVWDGAFAPSDDIVANLTCASPHMNVFTKPIMPVRHHYTNNIRIDNIILDMDPGWQVTRYYVSSCTGGTHGYDNIYRSMEALFLAHGPAFKWNLTVDAFENIELYNMFSDILNITASPNNGTAGSLDHLLQNPRTHSTETFTPYVETSKFSTAEEYATITSGNPCFRNCISFTKEHMRTLCENVTSSNTNDKHIPFGQPELESVYFSKRKVVISHLPVATIGYDQDQDASFWVSQTFTNVRENISADSGCSLPDPNIFKNVSGSRICSTDDAVSTSTLLLGDQSGMFDFVSSTMAIMKTGFLNNVWTPLLTFLREAVVMQTEVNVVVGPAFDHNFDSLPDLISHNSTLMTPSHFYIVLSHCSGDSLSKDCQNKSISSYILPHTENITICKNFSMYMLENEARLRDVEILTGLSFLSDLSTSVKVQLKTRLPVSRVSTALGEN
ncbi:PDE-like protein [Mya arenaria]|uniref:PDE-like protein n=1 Tax=Mya arenaria TaxID=6604 RepID=A0ABY7FLT6_MYAAR|nr:PDE-like protein [Mya arenaria]